MQIFPNIGIMYFYQIISTYPNNYERKWLNPGSQESDKKSKKNENFCKV